MKNVASFQPNEYIKNMFAKRLFAFKVRKSSVTHINISESSEYTQDGPSYPAASNNSPSYDLWPVV